jgi:hypothetical protein
MMSIVAAADEESMRKQKGVALLEYVKRPSVLNEKQCCLVRHFPRKELDHEDHGDERPVIETSDTRFRQCSHGNTS